MQTLPGTPGPPTIIEPPPQSLRSQTYLSPQGRGCRRNNTWPGPPPPYPNDSSSAHYRISRTSILSIRSNTSHKYYVIINGVGGIAVANIHPWTSTMAVYAPSSTMSPSTCTSPLPHIPQLGHTTHHSSPTYAHLKMLFSWTRTAQPKPPTWQTQANYSKISLVSIERLITLPGLLPKGTTTSWFFQSPRRGLAVLTHGNQKDPCLSKLYIVGFAIIY